MSQRLQILISGHSHKTVYHTGHVNDTVMKYKLLCGENMSSFTCTWALYTALRIWNQ